MFFPPEQFETAAPISSKYLSVQTEDFSYIPQYYHQNQESISALLLSLGSIQVSQSSNNDFYKKGSPLRIKCSIYLPQLFSQVQSGTVFQFFCYLHGIDTFEDYCRPVVLQIILICICLKFPHESSQTVYVWQEFQKGVCVLIASYQVMHDFCILASNGTHLGYLIKCQSSPRGSYPCSLCN